MYCQIAPHCEKKRVMKGSFSEESEKIACKIKVLVKNYMPLNKNNAAVGPTPIANEDRFLQNLKFFFDVTAVNISTLVEKEELLGFDSLT
jgi:hypothetical protein